MKFVFLSGISWTSCLGGRTVQLAKAAAREHEVHFVTIPGLQHWNIGTKQCGNITIHTLLPKSNNLPFCVCRYLNKKIGLQNAIVIVSNPAWFAIVSKLKAKKIIYDHLDYCAIHAPGKKDISAIQKKELSLMTSADLILPVSRKLFEQSPFPEKTRLLPNAVAEEFFQYTPVLPQKKVIGFHGAMYEWIDYQLLEEIADEFPDCTLKLAGPIRFKADATGLRRRKNVEFLPEFVFEKCPEIINSFSIGIIPFKDDEVSHCADPLKTYEYLAMGRCVISTVHSTAESSHFHLVTRENFCAEIAACLAAIPPVEECRDAVLKHTWQERFRNLYKMCETEI